MRALAVSAAAAFFLAAVPAAAQVPVPAAGLTVDGEVELMSDYRFRGVSRSDEDPAAQATLTVSHGSGVYVGARGTTLSGLDPLRDADFDDLGDVELDLYAGYGAELGGGLSVDGGIMYYLFTGSEGQADYVEPYASLSYMLGPVEATAGAKYAPSQDGIGNEDMLYLFAEAEAGIPFTPWTLRAHVGRQDWGAFGSYTNWSLGGAYKLGPAEIGLRYVDTDLPSAANQDAGLVLSIGFGF
jgi:uncharacterized protein (TIGR02001 family)